MIDCDDGRRYVVKGAQVGKALVAEQLVGRLGRQIGAPVVEVALVDVQQALIDNPFSARGTSTGAVEHFSPGLGHGAVWIDRCIEERDVLYAADGGNGARFASLAVLFGWFMAADHQYLYATSRPRLVTSHDHGYFLPGGPDWSAATLASAPTAQLDEVILDGAACSDKNVRRALDRLRGVSDAAIATAIAIPPASWGVSLADRVALAHFLARRRDELLASPVASR